MHLIKEREDVADKLLCVYLGVTEDCKEYTDKCLNKECEEDLAIIHECMKN